MLGGLLVRLPVSLPYEADYGYDKQHYAGHDEPDGQPRIIGHMSA